MYTVTVPHNCGFVMNPMSFAIEQNVNIVAFTKSASTPM